jgi:phage gp29-like protein
MSFKPHQTGLLVPASFAESSGPPVLEEIASTEDGRDITRGYVDNLDLLPINDTVLAAKGGGNLQLYEQLYSDDQVKLCFDQRQLGLISKEWYVEAGGTGRADKKAAALVEEALKHVAWDNSTQKMLMGVFYGYGVAECLWAPDGSTIMLDALKVKRQRRFGFAPDGSLRLLTTHRPQGEVLPPRKFWAFATGATDDDEPYGLGLGHWLYWPVWFKRNVTKFWLVYLEKFGMPTAVGKYPPGAAPDEKKKLLAAVRAVHRDSGITIPESMMIELLEASRASGADYAAFWDRMNSTISKIILGQSFSTEGHGGQYKGDNLMDVREDLIKADADLINKSFTQTVATWLTDWNYPGAAVPQVWRRVDDEPDLKATSETHKNVFALGYRPTLAEVKETYGGDWEEAKPAQPEPGAGSLADRLKAGIERNRAADTTTDLAETSHGGCCGHPPVSLAAPATGFADQDAIDVALSALLTDAELQTQMEALLNPVLQLAQTEPDRLMGRLAELYPDLADAALTEQLARLIFVAEVWGRLNARD